VPRCVQEEIQDLLIPKTKRPKKGLQIVGGQVKGLTHLPVSSVKEILAALDAGHGLLHPPPQLLCLPVVVWCVVRCALHRSERHD
jgi:hypothetical protein